MDFTSMVAALQNQWNTWNIRGFMILSLCMQLLLAIVTPFRQKTSNRFVKFVVWSAYLVADWAAIFAFGLISNAGCRIPENKDAQVPPDVLAFWAAFLLVHLGGPDNITAFSMEDNALWMRHLVGLIAQLSVFVYIFVKTLPTNRLLVPTILIFATGVINYAERTRALYLASLENLKKTIEKDTGREQNEGTGIFHTILMGLVVDIVPDFRECNQSRADIIEMDPYPTLRVISGELNLLYELLYTKIKASNSRWGKIARAIASYSTLAAFILFCTRQKHQFHGGDLAITCALFAGVFILHVANMMTLMTSSFSDYSFKELCLLVLKQGIFPPLLIIGLAFCLETNRDGADSVLHYYLFERDWSRKMASFNIMSHCFKQTTVKNARKPGFIWNKLAWERHVSKERIEMLLWSSVCSETKEKAKEAIDAASLRELYEARGDRALRRIGCDELVPYIRDFQFGHTLLIWHIATEICFNMHEQEDYINSDYKKIRILSKKLSDYMMYLLVKRPKLMSAVAGISHIRYKDTCAELKLLGRKELEVPTMRELCELILRGCDNINEPTIRENNHPFSVLKDSCKLVELLRGSINMWEVVYMVWMELLLYAAGHCRVDSHARLLSEGSEFITAIWVLMSLCGIGDHFPVNRP